MSDFHDFGLTWKCQKYSNMVAWLPQRLKSTFFEKKFSSLWVRVFFGDPPLDLFSKIVDFSLWGNQCALSCQNGILFRILSHCIVTIHVLTTRECSGAVDWLNERLFFQTKKSLTTTTVDWVGFCLIRSYRSVFSLFHLLCDMSMTLKTLSRENKKNLLTWN